MKTYNFKAGNYVILTLTLFFLFIVGVVLFALASPLLKGNDIIFILSCVGLILFIIYMGRLTSFAKVEVTVEDDSISIKWLGKFLWGNKPDITISFNEIAAYVTQSDGIWDWLTIEMKDGNTYKIWRNTFFINDDYSKFISAFVSSVENHNTEVTENSVKDNLTTIKKAKSIYETTGSLILAGFAIVIMVGIPISMVVLPSPTKEPNYFMFLLGYSGAIYFLYQVYTKRKERKGK